MLRISRITISVLFFILITFYFLDFGKILPDSFHALAHLQLVPALLSLSFGILLFWIIATLLFGRVYCSSVCPMGVFQDIITRIGRRFKSKKERRYKYSRPKTILRWGIVVLSLLTYIFSLTVVIGLFDPYSAFGRMATNLFRPLYLAGNNLLEAIFTGFGNYTFYKMEIYVSTISSLIVAIGTFIIVTFLAWKYGRTWCNTICPVGTVLGFLSRFSLFKIRIDAESCNACGKCATKCKASCIDNKTKQVDNSRCVACFNCIGSCNNGGLSYSLPKRGKKEGELNDSKRRFLAAGLATVALAPQAVEAKIKGNATYKGNAAPITPPGAISQERFMSLCSSCHLCVSKCPSRVLKPSFMEYGIGGMMQPTVSFEKGFCNYDCNICGNICPNNAITPLTVEEKHRTQIGYVVFKKGRCIVHKDETSCGACSEHCPTQAISMVPYKNGLTIPKINTEICVGCGGCEYVCPTSPRAVYIVGNSVHKEAKPFHDPEEKEIEIDGFGF